MSPRARFTAAALVSLGIGFSLGCGGGATPAQAKSVKNAGEEKSDSEASDEPAGSDDAPAPSANRCADGTCFECGPGICPKGFYCDEKAPGGPACGWLPECAASASCSCVKQALGAGCSCSEKGSGVSVSCQAP